MKTGCTLLFILFSIELFGLSGYEDYSALLKENVNYGNVSYKSLCKDPRLKRFIQDLSSTDPAGIPSGREKLAFWINAYNAYTLFAICQMYPVKSINDLHSAKGTDGKLKTTIWDQDFVTIGGKRTTLNKIEHEVIRKQFKEPRIHFALVCASKSCPALRPEAYTGIALNEQLDGDARIFLRDHTRNEFDLKSRTARLSKLFEWYGTDFGKDRFEILTFLAQFLPSELSAEIQTDAHQWNISYLDYDWSLNE